MRRITDLIAPLKVCLGVIVVLCVLGGVQLLARSSAKTAITVHSHRSCIFAGWDHQGDASVQMNLNCGSDASWTTSVQFISWYLQQKPGGQFACDVMENKEVDNCSYRPPK